MTGSPPTLYAVIIRLEEPGAKPQPRKYLAEGIHGRLSASALGALVIHVGCSVNSLGRIIPALLGNRFRLGVIDAIAHDDLSVHKDAPLRVYRRLEVRIPFQPNRRDRLHYASVEKMFRQRAARAGLPIRKGQSFHSLRHSTAQRLADMDVPVQDIQALLGHASSDTTMVYYTVSDKRLRATVERLNYVQGTE